MSLLNIIYIRNLLCDNLKVGNLLKNFYSLSSYSVPWEPVKNYHTTINHPCSFLVLASDLSVLNTESMNSYLTDQSLISPSFLTGFINKYWQETIFISKSNALSDKYISQLKSDGVPVYGNQYKKFLFDFSKALVKGRISTYLNESENTAVSHNTDIKYIWRKGLNLFSTDKKKSIFLNQSKNRYLDKSQVSLIKRLKNSKLPIFTITNNLNQIIVAEPADELIYRDSITDFLYQWYCNKFLYLIDTRPNYEGLFFVNSNDALEYKEYIKHKYTNYNLNNSQEKLNIVSSSLDTYYKLAYTSHARVKFHLVPDLEELGELIYNYQYYKNIKFHKKQKYGKFYFQGQPIYVIQSIYCKNKNSKMIDLVKYNYIINEGNKQEKYKTIFMNYDVALIAWKQFIDNHKQYKLPDKPQILVYNLEDFLKIEKNNIDTDKSNILFVPSRESYKFIKLVKNQKKNSTIVYRAFSQFLYFKIVAKRLIWSLTSKQPIN